jgi:hypothetical protein
LKAVGFKKDKAIEVADVFVDTNKIQQVVEGLCYRKQYGRDKNVPGTSAHKAEKQWKGLYAIDDLAAEQKRRRR